MSTDEPEDAPPPEFSRRRAIAALAANVFAMVFCFPVGGLIGTVVAGLGLSRIRTRPESASALVKWAWIIFGVSVALTLLFTIWRVATDPVDAPS